MQRNKKWAQRIQKKCGEFLCFFLLLFGSNGVRTATRRCISHADTITVCSVVSAAAWSGGGDRMVLF